MKGFRPCGIQFQAFWNSAFAPAGKPPGTTAKQPRIKKADLKSAKNILRKLSEHDTKISQLKLAHRAVNSYIER